MFCLAPLDHGQRATDYDSYGDLGLLHRLFDLFRSIPVLLRGAFASFKYCYGHSVLPFVTVGTPLVLLTQLVIEPAALRTVSVFGLDVSTLCFQFVCDSIELLLLYQTSSRAVFPFSIFGNLPRVFLALTSGGRRRPSITVLVPASGEPLLIGWLACASWLYYYCY